MNADTTAPRGKQHRPYCVDSGKFQYAKEKQAKTAASTGKTPLNVYKCWYCGMWHVTKRGARTT